MWIEEENEKNGGGGKVKGWTTVGGKERIGGNVTGKCKRKNKICGRNTTEDSGIKLDGRRKNHIGKIH
jgi:hypothetical protein